MDQSRIEGKNEGRAEGKAEGRAEGQKELLLKLVANGVLPPEEAACY